MLVLLREQPDGDTADAGADRHAPHNAPRSTLAESLYWTLYNPILWLLGLSLGMLNACRYGFLDWGVTHLMETQDVRVGQATLQFFVIAVGATAGSYLAGWATDRFFGSRRAPVICILMALLGASTLVYDRVVSESPAGTVALLIVIGFCIYGPQVLLVGTAPADLAHRGTSAAAAGFVNFMGYMGAATGDVVTGYYSAPEHGGWQTAIYIWAGWAFAGTAITALLWNTTTRSVRLMSANVPKFGALAALLVAGLAVTVGDLPLPLRLATYAAAVCLLGTWANRWAALPGLLVAGIGLLTVFVSYARMSDGATWAQPGAMAAYGLAVLGTSMVLLEREGEVCESS